MPKLEDSKQKQIRKDAPAAPYPRGYYDKIPDRFKGKLKISGNTLLIHHSVSTGNTIISFWRTWPEVKCPRCLLPYKVAVYLVPLDDFDDEWNVAGEVFAGGWPQCRCVKEKTCYLDINKHPGFFNASEEIKIKPEESVPF